MGRMEGNVLFNDDLNTFILIVISHIWEGRKEMFYLTILVTAAADPKH